MLDATRAAAAASGAAPSAGDAAAAVAAVAALATSQARTVADIAAAIPDLAPKPDSSYGAAGAAGGDLSVAGHDAAGPANVAWLSDLRVDGLASSLTVYNG